LLTIVPTPVTLPPALVTVAWATLLLVHVPPLIASVRLIIDPEHTLVGPAIAAGKGLTVTGAVTKQPLAVIVYDTVVKPDDRPVSTPPAVMVAVPAGLTAHVPPPGADVNVIDEFTHTGPLPPIGEGVGLTLITVVLVQPVVVSVKVIVVVPGPETPVTIPEPKPTVAMPILLLIHVPVPDPSLSVTVEPWQIVDPPFVIAAGVGSITTVALPAILTVQSVVAFVATTV
jgi:hypothetical protein